MPCALVKGEYGIGWTEVAVSEISSDIVYKELPERQLVTNYLVDLIYNPGTLIILESELAYSYCGMPKPTMIKNLHKKSESHRSEGLCRLRQYYHIEIE